jgi:hypothetical protein
VAQADIYINASPQAQWREKVVHEMTDRCRHRSGRAVARALFALERQGTLNPHAPDDALNFGAAWAIQI